MRTLFDKAFIMYTFILSKKHFIIKLYPINDKYLKRNKSTHI